MEEKHNLVPISIEYLFEGMLVTQDIYNYTGKVFLVKKGMVLTESMLERIRRINSTSKNIYVPETLHNELISRGLPSNLQQKHLEQKVGYTASKHQTASLIEQTKKTGAISKRDADEISADLTRKLNTVDVSLIFQCINGKNSIDEYLYTHSLNVALLNGLMGKWLKLTQKDIDLLVLCGLLHDVGKTKVPSEILNAPRKLEPREFEVIKQHSVHSFEILTQNPEIHNAIALAARHHHEKMNGLGYPDGLMADEIPYFARITAISDVYDAMVSRRCYKEPQSPFEILSELALGRFSDLDYKLIELFLKNMPQELIGKSVLMSDSSIGIVKYVDTTNWKYPIVEVDGSIVPTTPDLYCVSMTL